MTEPRLALHLSDDLREVVSADDIYYFEAVGDDTRVRLRAKRTRRDVRSLGQIARLLAPHGFLRVHRSYLVNLTRIRLLRRTATGGWELKLEPPVNRILPVSRRHAAALLKKLDHLT